MIVGALVQYVIMADTLPVMITITQVLHSQSDDQCVVLLFIIRPFT